MTKGARNKILVELGLFDQGSNLQKRIAVPSERFPKNLPFPSTFNLSDDLR